MSSRLVKNLLVFTGVLAVAAVAGAQSTRRAAEQFTFAIPTATRQATPDQQQLRLVITRWSTDAERREAMTALKEDGAAGLTRTIARNNAVGYIHWPGNLEYTLRYAWRVPRPDGGADLVLATDTPVSEWWTGQHASAPPNDEGTVIEVRVNSDGHGQGKLASIDKVTQQGTTTFVLSGFDTLPALMTDVKRAQAAG